MYISFVFSVPGLFVVLIAFIYLKFKRREDKRQKYMRTARTDPDAFVMGHPGSLHDLIEQSSGSGSGLPLLVSRLFFTSLQF